MARLFLVMCDSGDFDTAQEHVVCAYIERELAELHVEHCNIVGTRFDAPSAPTGDDALAHLRKHWNKHEALYLEAMRELDPEACVVDFRQGEYRVEETRLLREVPAPPPDGERND